MVLCSICAIKIEYYYQIDTKLYRLISRFKNDEKGSK